MSFYKLDHCPQGINTFRMTRVLRMNELVAVFSSYQDAQDFVEMKDLQKEQQRQEIAKAQPKASA